MNFYDILGLDKSCSLTDIKKAYHLLAIKYHPDKNSDPSASQKFQDIQMAYEVLRDEKKKMEYDMMNENQQLELYTSLKDYLVTAFPQYNQWIKLFYDKEDDFKKDINSLNFKSMFEHFNLKVANVVNNMDDIEVKGNNTNPNIYGEIKTSITNRYLNKYAKICVNRKTEIISNDKYYLVPLREDKIIYPNQGDININGVIGDLIVTVECENDSEFKIINKYDLCVTKMISLYQYLYGGNFKLKHLDSCDVDIIFDSMIEAVPIITIKNKGLPLSSPSFYIQNTPRNKIHYIDNTKIVERGSLYVYLQIDKLNDNDFKDMIKKMNN